MKETSFKLTKQTTGTHIIELGFSVISNRCLSGAVVRASDFRSKWSRDRFPAGALSNH